MSGTVKRREALLCGTGALVATAGCAELRSDSNSPDSRRGRTADAVWEILGHDDPILVEGPTDDEGPAFYAELVTGANEADNRLDWPTHRTELAGVDYAEYYLSVCTTRLDAEQFESAGLGRLVDGSVHYGFDLPGRGSWPENSDGLSTFVGRWERPAGVAETVSVDLRYE